MAPMLIVKMLQPMSTALLTGCKTEDYRIPYKRRRLNKFVNIINGAKASEISLIIH